MKKLLIISILFISLFSCRTAKKEWVKENFTSKEVSKTTEQDILLTVKEQEEKIKESILSEINETIKTISEKNTSIETNNTNISGSVEAEEGKEKTIDANGLKITTNGFNVKFESNSRKEISKEFEIKFNEIQKVVEEQKEYQRFLDEKYTSINNKFKEIEKEVEQLKTLQSKEVKTKGFSFGFILTLFLVIVLLVALLFFKSKIPFIKNL